ncbi:hypothetical protein NO932_06495 [Pelagibacterium sp. 26DY04]|uniref:hypothetical protein n=1 Tax=Pelagibacterium sp. 26DY04 TaxID=2967130 RepID=UPI0028163B4E|nr:hypothetical protein [Pelagibacterium sp. 26DY04]WMT88254.1 hypothetical protein NO932_06495 [Pelagibacterium sp. 26DY04]
MTDTPVDESQKTILFGGLHLEVTEPTPVHPVWVDLITELRVIAGVAHISFGSFIVDGSGPPEARVATRLRVPMASLYDLQQGIERILAEQEQAKKAAN